MAFGGRVLIHLRFEDSLLRAGLHGKEWFEDKSYLTKFFTHLDSLSYKQNLNKIRPGPALKNMEKNSDWMLIVSLPHRHSLRLRLLVLQINLQN